MTTDKAITDRFRIVIAHSNHRTLIHLHDSVAALGHDVVMTATTGEAIVQACRNDRPDIVISGVRMPDMDGIRALTLVGEQEPVPGVIVTPKADLELVEIAALDHIMAWLIEPVGTEELGPTLLLVYRRFEEFTALREEIQDLRSALSERKIIEKAKGILMKAGNLSEGDAFRRMQKLASAKRRRLSEIAKAIVDAEGAFD